MLMAWPLELLLFLAVADKPEGVGTVSGIVVFVLPTVFGVLMFQLPTLTCDPAFAGIPAVIGFPAVYGVPHVAGISVIAVPVASVLPLLVPFCS
jgi:hypothetical protein